MLYINICNVNTAIVYLAYVSDPMSVLRMPRSMTGILGLGRFGSFSNGSKLAFLAGTNCTPLAFKIFLSPMFLMAAWRVSSRVLELVVY